MGLSFTRPTYTLAKVNPKKQEEFKISFEGLKKLLDGETDYLLFQDESVIRDYQVIQKIWFIKGQQRIIPAYGKHHGVKLLGVLSYETGHVYCIGEEKYDDQVFMKFLQNILLQYPTGK